MHPHESVCLSLLKTGLWNRSFEFDKLFKDWDGVIKVAKVQSVLGVVGSVLVNTDSLDVPADVRSKLRTFVMRNVLISNNLENGLVKVINVLRDNGIEAVLLKGQGNARYYPMPELRQCGDVDLYVGQENYEKAYDVLKTEVATDIDEKESLVRGKHFHMSYGPVRYDIHRFTGLYSLPGYNRLYQEESLKGLQGRLIRLDFRDVAVYTPSLEYNAYYIFNHLFNHFMVSGIGLRHLCDLMMFLHSNYSRMDHVELKRILEKMDMLYPWQVFGGVLVKELGMSRYEFPFYTDIDDKTSRKVLRRILDEGNFGYETDYYKRHRGSYMKRKFNSLKWYTLRSWNLFSLFPKQAIRNLGNSMALGISIVAKDIKKTFGRNDD